MKIPFAVVLAGLGLAAAANAFAADDVPQLGRGLNLGNFLEAPHEGLWSGGRTLQAEDFSNIKQAGFSFVRVPICWSAHVSVIPAQYVSALSSYSIDPAFFQRVDWVVAQAEKNHLKVILDYHNDDELMKNPDAAEERFVTLWQEIAGHYENAPDSVLFELLNEPNGKLDAPRWNAMLPHALAAIRATNPTRTVVVGPVKWNSTGALPGLILPDSDRHLLVTIHFYDPFHFTHQGAHWVGPFMDQYIGTKWMGTDAEKKAISDTFDRAAKWGLDHHRPMYLGEFGSFEKGDMDSRARWTAFVARTAEAHGMAWSYWEYCAGFGAYDPIAKQWRKPLLRALMPQ